MTQGSVSFDRAAAFYDRTRITDEAQLAAAVGFLHDALPSGRVLEIGVGTGALAVPLAARGRSVVGVDLSGAMLARLRAKDADLHVAIADATRLPLPDGAVAGAYCRWVLHLIADWPAAVAELCRVVRRPGVIIVEPGGYSGAWRAVHERFVDELGPAAEPIGLRMGDGAAELDAAFAEAGAPLRSEHETPGFVDSSLGRFFAEAAARAYSWTWRVDQADLDRAVPAVRAWAIERFGPDLDAPFSTEAPHRWRVYERA